MTIKATWIVTDMGINPQTIDPNAFYSGVVEHKTEKAAIAAAKKYLNREGKCCEDEVWVWKLSHVVSRPETEPDVETAK